jgi:hypothetical protein
MSNMKMGKNFEKGLAILQNEASVADGKYRAYRFISQVDGGIEEIESEIKAVEQEQDMSVLSESITSSYESKTSYREGYLAVLKDAMGILDKWLTNIYLSTEKHRSTTGAFQLIAGQAT